MDLFSAIKTRKSVRKYLDKKVPNDMIGAIIEAGTMAPSSGNKQNWKFIIVKDSNTKEEVAKHCKEQYWMTRAAAYIVVCSDDSLIEKFYGERGVNRYSVQNCAAAIQNMLLAANDLGLGACWIGAFDEEEVCNDLDISGGAKPQAIITIGFPTREIYQKKLKEFNSMVYLEKYGNTIKDISPFVYDWGNIVSGEIDKITNDLKPIIIKEFKDSANLINEKWSSVINKFKKRYLRRLDR